MIEDLKDILQGMVALGPFMPLLSIALIMIEKSFTQTSDGEFS